MTASTAEFAKTIRTLRLRAGLSQEELAERAGVSARAISDMERGLRKSARPETLRLLSEALQLPETERARLFAAAHPELDAGQNFDTAPPATALPLAIRPLPIPPDELVGREADIAAIGELMNEEGARLITLTGPGGVGKTRLGLAVAERYQDQWAEGAAFIDLAPLADAERIPPAIAFALGLTFDSGSPAHETVATALRDRSLLLMLDNMEHLLEASAWITRLVAEARHITVLVTSRGRLRIRGEHVYPVAPLAVPSEVAGRDSICAADSLRSPAVRLFRDRTRQTGYGFVLDDRNAPAIAELCRRLDGLPLAIELAASRVGLLPPESLLDKLETLSGGHRDSPERQQTLQHAISWSYDLLDPTTQTVYRRLSVFSGGFTLEAAESVAGGPGMDVLASIGTLAESSLLTPVPAASAPRFTMLETIHRDAAARLERSNEAGGIRRRHADWVISLLETAGADLSFSRNSPGWYAGLNVELGSLRRAVAFLIESEDGDSVVQLITAAGTYFLDTLHYEAAQWIEAALRLVKRSPVHARVIALSYFVICTAFQNDRASAEPAVDRLRQWMSETDDPLAIGSAYLAQGISSQISGLYADAVDRHRQALSWFQRAGYPAWIVTSMLELGNCLLLSGAVETAWSVLDEGVALAGTLGSDSELAYGLEYLGYTELTRGNLQAAAAGLAGGLDQALSHRILRESLGCLGGMAGVARASGAPEPAARLLGAMEAARQSSGIRMLTNQPLIDEIADSIRDELGYDRDVALRREGALLTFEEAVELARSIKRKVAGDCDTFESG